MNSLQPSDIATAIISKYHGQKITHGGLERILTEELAKYAAKFEKKGKIAGFKQARQILIDLECME